MLLIISVQKYDTLGEIIHKLNDYNEKKKFLCKERLALMMTLVVCAALAVGYVSLTIWQVNKIETTNYLEGIDISVLVLMTIIFWTLVYKLWQ